MTRARTSLPAFISYLHLDCGVCLACCVMGGEDTDISSVVQVQRRHTLGIPLVQTTCIAAAGNEKQPSLRSGYNVSTLLTIARCQLEASFSGTQLNNLLDEPHLHVKIFLLRHNCKSIVSNLETGIKSLSSLVSPVIFLVILIIRMYLKDINSGLWE